MNLLNLTFTFLTFCGLFLSILFQIRNPLFIKIISGIFSILIIFEFISYWALGVWIGYEFLSNFHWNLIIGFIFDFKKEFVLAILFTFFIFLILLNLLKIYRRIKKIFKILILVISLYFLIIPNNPLAKIIEYIEISFTEVKDFKKYLPNDFTQLSELNAQPGKNIIFISIESLEKNFLDYRYGNFTPNLNKLKNDYNFYTMKQDGAGWTSGSLYTLLTSIPAVYPSNDNGNYWFQSIEKFKIPTLGNILSRAGYKSVYVMANPEFSGTEYLLKANFFDIVSEKNNLGDFKSTHDLDLFNEAKRQVAMLNAKNKPFALFLSTIDTHFPKGNFDKNMENILNKQFAAYDNPINFSIESIDYLIGDFIDYLKTLKILENTIFIIVPDHRMMGSGEHIDKIKKINRDRDLFLVTNASIKTENVKQTLLPRLIIDAAEINSNARFLSDYDENDINKINIAQLNKTIISKDDWFDNLNFYIKQNKLIVKSNNTLNYEIDIPDNIKNINFIFNSKFEFLEARINEKTPYRIPDIKKMIQLTVYFENKEPKKYYLGNYLGTGRYTDIGNSFIINKKQISKIKNSNEHSFIAYLFDEFYFVLRDFITPKIFYIRNIKDKLYRYFLLPQYKAIFKDIVDDKKRFIAHAGGKIDDFNYTNSLEALNNSYKNGLKLFELDIIKTSDGHFVAAHDWKHWKSIVNYPNKDEQPVSINEFMKYKIHNKYTPIGINQINNWFLEHKDAILVTDKVNSPFEFSNLFVDKKRLMMELFTIDAINEAIDANILEAIPTHDLWGQIKNNNQILKNIHFIAAGRKISYSDVREIQSKKLKIYAFHLNSEKHANEIWSICNESNLFYGFYVDKTDFLNQSINCKNY